MTEAEGGYWTPEKLVNAPRLILVALLVWGDHLLIPHEQVAKACRFVGEAGDSHFETILNLHSPGLRRPLIAKRLGLRWKAGFSYPCQPFAAALLKCSHVSLHWNNSGTNAMTLVLWGGFND